jgi:hypothetical protein
MFFSVESDEGRAIRGWIALDDPAAAPRLILVAPGRPELSIEANLHRPDIAGVMAIHQTGHVGFEIDSSVVADLADLDDLSLLEAESRLPIFRRCRPHDVRKRIFLFDASVMPQTNLMRELSAHFSNVHLHCERLNLTTLVSIIKSWSSWSTLLYGRALFSRYASYLRDAGFMTAALLQDPFLELAERLLTLKLFASGRLTQAGPIFGLERGLAFAQELTLNDETAMLQAFRRLDPDQRDLFVNPMTRLFGCEAGETPHRRHVSVALETLAGVDLVGVRSDFALFQRMLTATLGANVFGAEAPVTLELVEEVAHKLARIGIVEDMLDGDVQLHEFVKSAVRPAPESDPAEARREFQ